jgi:uncharacterized protein (DUF2141 family)
VKLLLLPLSIVVIADAPAAPIEVLVSGVRSAQGKVWVSVCPEKQFLGDCPISASVPAQVGTVTVVLNNVPSGRYAVQAFHDANGNGKVDRNWLGLPREGIGFSNDAMPRLTYPRFSVAGFDHGTTAQRISVRIRYFLG